MFEIPELINFSLSTLMVIYLVSLYRQQNKPVQPFFLGALVLMILGQVATLAEGVIALNFFNICEHLSFTLAMGLFLISLIKHEI